MNLYLVTLVMQLLTTQVLADQSLPDPHHYRELLGKRVVLEGIVWDNLKGWKGRVLTPSGQQVFIANGFTRPKQGSYGREYVFLDGKLVRVVGVLSFKMGKLPGPKFTPLAGITIAQPAYVPSYFSLELESYEIIGQAKLGKPELLPKN